MKWIRQKLANSDSINLESGVTAIEYGLIAALIAIVIIAGVSLAGTNLNTLFNNVANYLHT